jgi:hypothetical protein
MYDLENAVIIGEMIIKMVGAGNHFVRRRPPLTTAS